MNKIEKKKFIQTNAVFTREAAAILGVGRTQINNLVTQEILIPIKKTPNAQLFLIDDVLAYKYRKRVTYSPELRK